MLELVPLPLPRHESTRLALSLMPAINKHGAAAVAEQRIKQMSKPGAVEDITSRILNNTSIGFSMPQLRHMVRRELISITRHSWTAMRKD